jgi:carbonic anhydrase
MIASSKHATARALSDTAQPYRKSLRRFPATFKSAIDDVVLGNLTGLLARIKPAIPATKFDGEKSSKNGSYVDAVARTNVVLGLAEIRRRSPILEGLKKKGDIKIVGAMYDLATGVVGFVG